MNYIQYDYCILYKEHDPFKWHCMWGTNRSYRLVLYNPFEDRFEGKHFVLCYRLCFWWCVPWEYQQCCCTRDIYGLKYNSTMIFLCGTKTSTDYLDWNKLYLFFEFFCMVIIMASWADCSTLVGFRMTEPKQWWLATWLSHDFATCAPSGCSGSGWGFNIQSNAVIHTQPDQVCAHSDLVR